MNITSQTTGRIHSVDVLRGITLLGILLVHTVGLFGFSVYREYLSESGIMLANSISLLLSSRCAPVFSMLFGVSFYLILRKPTYSSWKFMWRCLLLMGLGLINKLFYTYDALMWYGVWGIVLLLFRYASPWVLIISAVGLRFVAIYLSEYGLGDLLFPSDHPDVLKYTMDGGMHIFIYPLWESIKDYLRVVFNGGIFITFTYFLFGYWIAKKGYIENLERHSNIKIVIVTGIFYFVFYLLYSLTKNMLLLSFGNWFGSLFMAVLFLYIYYKHPSWFGFFESYGKLGLTNYTFQSLFGVLFMVVFAIPFHLDMSYILLSLLLFYVLQCVFSSWWLEHFTNGPLEWFWRCLTNRMFVSPLKRG